MKGCFHVDLAFASAVLQGLACVVCFAYAYARRSSPERQDALALACVWFGWFLLGIIEDLTGQALPAPSDVPLSGIRNRAILAVNSAAYLAWPLGMAAWIRWTFVRAKPLPFFFAWLVAFGIPTAVYPAIRGVGWFRLAGTIHIGAFIGEIVAIRQWAKRREKPQPWHGIALAAAGISTLPAISFFASPENFESYGNWVLRGLIGLHLWVLAMVGGAKWKPYT